MHTDDDDAEWVSIGDHLIIREGPGGTMSVELRDDSPEAAAGAGRALAVADSDSIGPAVLMEQPPHEPGDRCWYRRCTECGFYVATTWSPPIPGAHVCTRDGVKTLVRWS